MDALRYDARSLGFYPIAEEEGILSLTNKVNRRNYGDSLVNLCNRCWLES